MPIYEYACGACGHEFEEWQKMSDPPVKTCPKCKKKKVERLISQTAFQLKGGGWYADLYASSKPGKDKAGDGGGSAKDAGSSASGGSGGTSDASKSESSGAKDKSDKSEKKDKKDSKETKSAAKKSETRAA